MNIELEKIELKEDDLLFYKKFIEELGGREKARLALLDIIERYFNLEYIDIKQLNERGLDG